MITSAFIFLFATMLGLVLDILPSYAGLPAGLDTALNYIFGLIAGISDFVPMDTVWTLLLLSLGIELSILGFNFFQWLFHWKQAK